MEFKDEENLGIKIGHCHENEKYTFMMQEISRMFFTHPYMIYCKGSQQVIIRSFDRVKESLIYELPKNEIFMSFLGVDSYHSAYSYVEADVLYPGIDEA